MLKLEKKAQGKHQRDTSWRSQARHTGPLKPWDLTWRVENTSVPHTSLPCQQCSSIIARLQLQELQDTGSLWGGWFREIQNQESRRNKDTRGICRLKHLRLLKTPATASLWADETHPHSNACLPHFLLPVVVPSNYQTRNLKQLWLLC